MTKFVRSALASAAVLALSPAYASDGAPAGEKPKRPKADAPIIGEISGDYPMPTVVRGTAGSRSPFPWDKLEIGQSFPVTNKTTKQMSSIVSNQNRKKDNQRQKTGENGEPLFEQVDVKDGNGVVVGKTNGAPITEKIKEFFVAEVPSDPKNPKSKKQVRVFRKS